MDKVESDVNGNILNEEYNKYKFYCDTAQTKFKSVNGIKVGFTFYNLPNPFYGSNYGIAPYQVLTEFPMLYSKTIIKHNQNNNSLKVIDSTHYYYSDSCLLSKIESWNSLGEKNITVIKYPYDYSTSITNEPISQAINMFKENHIILPIEKMIFIKHSSEDSLLLSSSIMTYTIQSINNKNFIFPKDLYDTKLVTPKQNYIPSTILNGVFSFDQSIFKRESSIDSYNEFDRMTQMHKENNVNNSYIWGYNNQYMVIKAVNIDAVSLSTIVNNIQPDFQSFLTGLDDLTDPAKRSQWKLFNNTLRSGLPPNSRAETFTYLPFIGITSKTDEAGITTYYYYDDFGRLLNVKDEEGNIVKKYDYHYQGQ
ncbi:MAG: RHS repeat domain-containing protein [Bacteroidota bacterium]|nr:RHS repeat domain-containing protein [Bacteroidota bacterium]